ncbi:MAG TPA: DUF3971 domain-containing protein, partial [Methylomirabilota bacterium]|nr:DUF3971 domain-containing protein [Methylomirabilota bacterium]
GGRPDGAPVPAEGATPALDRIEIRGVASVEDARLELDDLLLMSGHSGLRVRGEFVGGAGAVGVDLEGIARDLPTRLIKRLWPPVVAGAARTWMTDNVVSGRITDASFRIAIPPATLAAALDGAAVPDDMVAFEFSLADVDMRYFGELPPVTGASGSGRLSGDSFRIELENGVSTLPSGDQVQFRRGIMSTIELASVLSPTVLHIEAAGEAPAVLELLDMEPLRLVTEAGFDRSKFGGKANVNVTIEMPLAKDIPDGSVRVTANAKLDNAQFRDALEGMSIEDGDLAIDVDETSFRVSGPVVLNGTAANLAWSRPLGPDGNDEIVLNAELDEADRERFGASLGAFLRGPVKVRGSARAEDGRLAHARVEADLTNADLRLDAIGWSRPAGGKVAAGFDLDLTGNDAVAVRDLTIAGERLELAGNLRLGRDGSLREAAFATVRLDGDTDVAISVRAADHGLSASVTGQSFDARPLIDQLFSTSSSSPDADALTMRIEADVQRLLAHRGEAISEVRGSMQLTGGVVDAADLAGRFSNGGPVSLKVVPAGSELRQLKLTGGDGGAALRAVDLYSKVKGGAIDFSAWLGPGRTGSVQRGLLVIDRFDVENEVVLDEVDLPTGRGIAGAPRQRREGLSFTQLKLPFSVDETYIRIGDALVRGPEMGASAQGHIRKADGRLDIGGTIIPAYALNAALSDIPLLGDLLTGGKGEGMFGVTYALKGSRRDPEVLFNP